MHVRLDLTDTQVHTHIETKEIETKLLNLGDKYSSVHIGPSTFCEFKICHTKMLGKKE